MKCNVCEGRGKIVCPYCEGTGKEPADSGYGTQACFKCGRDGEINCPKCNGTGVVEDK